MNRTINVNIGGYPFIIDEDAHLMLSNYFQQIECRLSPMERKEIMEDVEIRIADIFSQRIGVRTQVVGINIVREAICIIGNAEDFGESDQPELNQAAPPSAAEEHPRKKIDGIGFRRSRTDRVLGGICGGIAPVIGIDVTIIRLILVLLIILSASTLFWVYIILWIIVPEESITDKSNQPNERR